MTRTHDNAILPLPRSYFCFLQIFSITILPSITRTMFKRLTSRKKQRTAVQNITENLFQNNNVFFVLTFSSVQLKYNVLALCCELCIILALLLHPISFNMFLINYLLRTPDSSNCFRFPLKVRVIGSQMNCRFLMTSQRPSCWCSKATWKRWPCWRTMTIHHLGVELFSWNPKKDAFWVPIN